jgi:hypothetical protein
MTRSLWLQKIRPIITYQLIYLKDLIGLKQTNSRHAQHATKRGEAAPARAMEADAPPNARSAKAGLERTARREGVKRPKRLAQTLKKKHKKAQKKTPKSSRLGRCSY